MRAAGRDVRRLILSHIGSLRGSCRQERNRENWVIGGGCLAENGVIKACGEDITQKKPYNRAIPHKCA